MLHHEREIGSFAWLAEDPEDVDRLREFALFSARRGQLDAALTAAKRAVMIAPWRPDGIATVAHILHDRGEWRDAYTWYERALALQPDDPMLHEGALYTARRLHDEVLAARHRNRAFQGRKITTVPYRGSGKPIRVLILVSAEGGNVDTRPFLSDGEFEIIKDVIDVEGEGVWPEHDIVFQAIGDADKCTRALMLAEERLRNHAQPVLNQPGLVQRTTRLGNAQRFRHIAGVRVPKSMTISRDALHDRGKLGALFSEHDIPLPCLVRALGFHTGEFCEYASSIHEVQHWLEDMPGQEKLAVEFVELRAGDGYARKYRAMIIDGEVYPIHMAASTDWKVHYYRSAMTHVPALRAEENVYLQDPAAAIGDAAWCAVNEILRSLGLDYAGLDFGIDAAGSVVCFEANATMVVSPAPRDAIWDYRRPVAGVIADAVRRMLHRRSSPSTAETANAL